MSTELFGSTVWARKTIESEIFYYKPAVWFKIWFFIISKVNHADTHLFPRGTNLFNFANERVNLRWCTEDQWKKCLDYLRKASMISTKRSTRGNVITVLRYAEYQDAIKTKSTTPSTESGTTGSTKVARSAHEGSTPINKNGKHDNNYNHREPKNLSVDKTVDNPVYRDGATLKLYDGTTALLRFGKWVDAFSGVLLDRNYYKELP